MVWYNPKTEQYEQRVWPVAPKCTICDTYGEGENNGPIKTVINMVGGLCVPCIDKAIKAHKEQLRMIK